MAAAKTQPTKQSPAAFVAAIKDPVRRKDCETLIKLMKKLTDKPAVMWGPSIVGFDTYTYVYATGRSGDWPIAAFSPRKNDLTVYLMAGFEKQAALMKKLGKHKTGKVCLYLKSLEGIDLEVLANLIEISIAHVRKMYPKN